MFHALLSSALDFSFFKFLHSVSNPVYTDTGILVFGTPNTDTGKNLPVFAGIENA
jgi:hypothetical protein